MFRLFVVVCTIISICLSAPTDDYENFDLPTLGIIGGTFANIDKFPYQVSVQLNGGHHCGGAIVQEKVVITAAHCTYGFQPKNFVVRAGSDIHSRNGVVVSVKKIVNHPIYKDGSMTHDIAIVFLEKGLPLSKNIGPITLPSLNEKPRIGQKATVSGWGYTKEDGQLSLKLLKTDVTVISHNECKRSYQLTDAMICAGEISGGKDACQADSGGPLVQNGKLIGVVSFGIGCGRPGFAGVYTFVAYLRQWIDNTIVNGLKYN